MTASVIKVGTDYLLLPPFSIVLLSLNRSWPGDLFDGQNMQKWWNFWGQVIRNLITSIQAFSVMVAPNCQVRSPTILRPPCHEEAKLAPRKGHMGRDGDVGVTPPHLPQPSQPKTRHSNEEAILHIPAPADATWSREEPLQHPDWRPQTHGLSQAFKTIQTAIV